MSGEPVIGTSTEASEEEEGTAADLDGQGVGEGVHRVLLCVPCGEITELQSTWFAYADAADGSRDAKGIAFANALQLAWDATPKSAGAGQTSERVRAISQARLEYERALAAWAAAANSPLGTVSVALGVAERPD